MCTKTPKPQKVEEKPIQWLRNPLLDGLAIGGGTAKGRASMRRDLGVAGAAFVSPYDRSKNPTTPEAAPTAGRGTGLAVPTAGGRRVSRYGRAGR